MSQEPAPEHPAAAQTAHDRAHPKPAAGAAAPKSLLQQMEELMAALNADLSQLDADLQSTTPHPPATEHPAHRPS